MSEVRSVSVRTRVVRGGSDAWVMRGAHGSGCEVLHS